MTNPDESALPCTPPPRLEGQARSARQTEGRTDPRAESGPEGDAPALVDRLDSLLPQTQCMRCGYDDCRGYAQALAEGRADIDQCPPGGAEGIARLARALARPPRPLSAAHGVEAPRRLAFIDEDWCIGCTLCIAACPVDCILGASKLMHAVIESQCTGCELCLLACPVDCISMEDASGTATGWQAWSTAQADTARERYAQRQARHASAAREHEARQLAKAETKLADLQAHTRHTDPAVLARKREVIETALLRARARAQAGK